MKSKLKISSLLKETGAFVLTFQSGILYTKKEESLSDMNKQESFRKIFDNFRRRKEMFKCLSDTKKYFNSPEQYVGFFIKEAENDSIEISLLYFKPAISISNAPMGEIHYQKFFDEFIDLEGKTIVVKDPE